MLRVMLLSTVEMKEPWELVLVKWPVLTVRRLRYGKLVKQNCPSKGLQLLQTLFSLLLTAY